MFHRHKKDVFHLYNLNNKKSRNCGIFYITFSFKQKYRFISVFKIDIVRFIVVCKCINTSRSSANSFLTFNITGRSGNNS